MAWNLILLGAIFLCTILLTVLRGLFNLPKPETVKEKLVRRIFVCIAALAICLNVFLGIRTYIIESDSPYKLDRQQISMSIRLKCDHCTDSDIDSIKSLPTQFTVNSISIGSLNLNCDFTRIETPVKISGPRAASREMYYRSSCRFSQKKNNYDYLWDLNGENVSLNLPNEFDEIFAVADTSKRWGSAWWSGQLIIEVGGMAIGEGKLNPKQNYQDHPGFQFDLKELSKKDVKNKW